MGKPVGRRPKEENKKSSSGSEPKIRRRTAILTIRRKILIEKFKMRWRINSHGASDKHSKFLEGSKEWKDNLFLFLNQRDNAISKADVERWIASHSWITDPKARAKGLNVEFILRETSRKSTSSDESQKSGEDDETQSSGENSESSDSDVSIEYAVPPRTPSLTPHSVNPRSPDTPAGPSSNQGNPTHRGSPPVLTAEPPSNGLDWTPFQTSGTTGLFDNSYQLRPIRTKTTYETEPERPCCNPLQRTSNNGSGYYKVKDRLLGKFRSETGTDDTVSIYATPSGRVIGDTDGNLELFTANSNYAGSTPHREALTSSDYHQASAGNDTVPPTTNCQQQSTMHSAFVDLASPPHRNHTIGSNFTYVTTVCMEPRGRTVDSNKNGHRFTGNNFVTPSAAPGITLFNGGSKTPHPLSSGGNYDVNHWTTSDSRELPTNFRLFRQSACSNNTRYSNGNYTHHSNHDLLTRLLANVRIYCVHRTAAKPSGSLNQRCARIETLLDSMQQTYSRSHESQYDLQCVLPIIDKFQRMFKRISKKVLFPVSYRDTFLKQYPLNLKQESADDESAEEDDIELVP